MGKYLWMYCFLFVSINLIGQEAYSLEELGENVWIRIPSKHESVERTLDNGHHLERSFITTCENQVVCATWEDKMVTDLVNQPETTDSTIHKYFLETTFKNYIEHQTQVYFRTKKIGKLEKKYPYLDVLSTVAFPGISSSKKQYVSTYVRWILIEKQLYRLSCTTGDRKGSKKTAAKSRGVLLKDFKNLINSLVIKN